MISRTRKPEYAIDRFQFADLGESYFGRILIDNGVDIQQLQQMVRILTRESARSVWMATFGDAVGKMAIDPSNWTSQLTWMSQGDWIPHYNKRISSPVEEQLRSLTEWSEDRSVLFIRGPIDCVYTDWGTFVSNWMSFAEYDDDGPYLIPVIGDRALRITPHGQFMISIVE